jgi:Fe-S cluster assembly iron-binding protein IscA
VIIDAKSLIYLDGTEVDFVKEGLNEGFEFNNLVQFAFDKCALKHLNLLQNQLLARITRNSFA